MSAPPAADIPPAAPIPAAPPGATPPAADRARIDPPVVPRNKYALPRESLRFMPRLEGAEHHPTSWSLPDLLGAHTDAPWRAELRALYAEPVAFPASISPQAGLLLHALVLNLRPRVAVETGTFIGASAIWIAAAIAAPAVLHAFDQFSSVEPGPWRADRMDGDRVPAVRARLQRAGQADRVLLHPGDSATQLVRAREDLRRAGGVDFALLDGDHSVEGATRDLWALEPVLNTGGCIVLHDTIPEQCGDYPGPRHIVDRINQIAQGLYEKCELYLAPLNYGLAVLRRIG